MGDRGNIFFVDQRDEDEGTCEGIYMYAHWAGYDLPQILQDGLKRGENRWDDPQYLPRILFCEMVKDDIEGERGYGLSTVLCDNEHAILRVDPYRQRIDFVRAGTEKNRYPYKDADYGWTFEEYVNADIDVLNHYYKEHR